MRTHTVIVVLGMEALLMVASMVAHAQGLFEKLVMPGPLSHAHAQLEKDCHACHEPFTRQSQTGLCLTCHKAIAVDRKAARGFHGRQREASSGDCKACHSEHKGRAFDITQLNRETFNHALTNFMLVAAHKRASCDGCHASQHKYREAAGRCSDCHQRNDPHKGRLGAACDGCHTEQGWRQIKPFDHGKTRFALLGAHREVACTQCHVGERYKDLPRTCVSCHGLQDKHAGAHGDSCDRCHSPAKWARVAFNHDTATAFPLRGGHAKLSCERCHTGNIYRDKLATACIACHRKDDPHHEQLGSNCGRCHNETGWHQKVAFDHDLTRFPLLGLHAVVACEECHRSQSFKDASTSCGSCHRDAHHLGRLGSDCARCHNPNGWARWRFDHDRQTNYALTGSHRGLDCHACHTQRDVVKVSAPTGCYGCHKRDDAHEGAFGRACDKCHTTFSFKQGARG